MLSELRKNKLFAEGKYKCLLHEAEVFAFERYYDNEKIIIAVNMSEDTITLRLKENMKEYYGSSAGTSFNLNSEEYLVLFNG